MAGEGSGLGQAVLSSPDLSLSGSVTLYKARSLSGPQSPHLYNEEVGQMVSDRIPSNPYNLCPFLSKVLSSSQSPQPLFSILEEPDWKGASCGLGMKGTGRG